MPVISRLYRGTGITQGITPVCTCGWRGYEEFAYNDWQMTNLRDQELAHCKAKHPGERIAYASRKPE